MIGQTSYGKFGGLSRFYTQLAADNRLQISRKLLFDAPVTYNAGHVDSSRLSMLLISFPYAQRHS
jgi:hypothetical protein